MQPPCTRALIRGRVARVVGAMTDPDPRVAGMGYRALRDASIEVDAVELPEAQALNAGFVRRTTTGRPLVRLKIAASMDGRTAMASGESQWITGAEARADVQAGAPVAAPSSPASAPCWPTTRGSTFGTRATPPREPCDNPWSRLPTAAVGTPVDAGIFATGARVVLFAGTDAADTHERAEVVRQAGSKVDLGAMLDALGNLPLNEVLVEAGATLTGAFIEQGLWDEAVVYLAPKFLGDAARPMAAFGIERLAQAARGTIVDIKALGADLRVVLARAN